MEMPVAAIDQGDVSQACDNGSVSDSFDMQQSAPLLQTDSEGGSQLCSTARPVTLIASQAGVGPSATGTARPYKKKVKKLVDITGFVVKDLGNGMFSIKLENGVSVMAHLSGKIRQNRIKIVSGDQVTVELSPYDLTRGRITHRHKPGELAKAAEAAEAAKAL
ncbi:hypothetical protein QJQ45_015460 [Haematococcus lacustris]|nr:hypothetical protein QJQ45_015460 [Haematococcus lacustris]